MTKDAVISFTHPLRRVPGLQGATDKLLHNATISILVFLFFLTASKPLFGSPIVCQLPKEYPESAVAYISDMCYFGKRERIDVRLQSSRGSGKGTMSHNVLTGTSDFYMWVPLLPILHGILTILPVFFWKFFGLDSFHGADIIAFIEYYTSRRDEAAKEGPIIYPEEWRFLKQASQFQEWIKMKKGSWYGPSQTMCIYVTMKWFRFAIFSLQLWMVAYIFGDGNLYWGFKDLMQIIQGSVKNPLVGPFTLVTGCAVIRLQMGIDDRVPVNRPSTNVNNVKSNCMLSANYVNAKAFLFLYWWFLLVTLVSFCSAVYYTFILIVPRYRRYKISTMIRNEDYFTETCGEPHPELDFHNSAPLDYMIQNLGNDGYLVCQMIYDVNHFGCYRFAEHIWTYSIVNNEKMPTPTLEISDKEKPSSPVMDTEMDGAGDRYRGGKDKSKHKKSSFQKPEVITEEDSNSRSKISLSGVSQSSLATTESDEEPLIDPKIIDVLSK